MLYILTFFYRVKKKYTKKGICILCASLCALNIYVVPHSKTVQNLVINNILLTV